MTAITILRRKQVEQRTGLSRSAIYAKLHPSKNRPEDYDPTFPKQITLGPKSVGWIEAEIDQWIALKIKQSRGG